MWALLGLTGDSPLFDGAYPEDTNVRVSTRVKVVVGTCGVYERLAEWQHVLSTRPRDNIAENYLGVSAIDDKFAYFSAPPLVHVRPIGAGPAVLITGGTEDDVVDWETQAKPFASALKHGGQAAFQDDAAG